MQILRIYLRVLKQLEAQKRIAIVLILANLCLAIAQFAEPILFGRIIDRLTSATAADGWAAILPLAAAWVGFGLFTIAAGVLVALHADRLAHAQRLTVMARYFEHVLHLPLSFHTNVHSGRLLKVMLDGANGMCGLWLAFFREHCASFVALTILLPLTLVINWRLAGLLIVLVFIFGLLTSYVLRRTEGLQSQVEKYHVDLAERASDALGNIPVIQSFTRAEAEAHAMRATFAALLAAQVPVLSWWAVAAVASRASATLTVLGIFALGTSLHFHQLASVGEIVTFMNVATMLISRLEQIVAFINFLFLQAPKLSQFFEVLDTTPTVRDKPGALDIGRPSGQVTFEHVSFTYDGRRNAISDVSFSVAPGETIALVGVTGSGKSTTLGLLHRVFDPQSGRILVDGQDLRDVTLASLRRNIGVVFQEPMLFARSIEENLRVGKADATQSEILLALERAQAADFAARQPDGLAAIVAERGRALSGGERQRLAIARALLKDPPILIFDEATSALDAATERQLQAALQAATKGRTTFIIAHRFATVRHATRILVFDNGRIIESGSFDDLIRRNGRFTTLARAQFVDEKPQPVLAAAWLS
jgi:ATP-binding cassette subfamily B protein